MERETMVGRIERQWEGGDGAGEGAFLPKISPLLPDQVKKSYEAFIGLLGRYNAVFGESKRIWSFITDLLDVFGV